MPVIYCDKDMSEVVLKKSGLCAKNHTPEAMAELIKHIFSYPDLIGQMSKHALKNRDQALQSTQIIKLINLYKTLLT